MKNDVKEKSVELHDKFYQIFESLGLDEIPNKQSIMCVEILIDEVINEINHESHSIGFWNSVRNQLYNL